MRIDSSIVRRALPALLSPALGLAPLAAMAALAVGAHAPDFTAQAALGGKAFTFSLAQALKKGPVVLYFYPKAFTKGCTIEAHNFQRDLSKFEAENAVILGVSVDTVDSHKQFCTKDGLTFHLLADPEHKVVDEYGSLGHFGNMTIAMRNTFLIDPKGKIVRVWTKVDPNVHSTEVLAAIQDAKKG